MELQTSGHFILVGFWSYVGLRDCSLSSWIWDLPWFRGTRSMVSQHPLPTLKKHLFTWRMAPAAGSLRNWVSKIFKHWSIALRSLSSKPKTYLQVPIPLSLTNFREKCFPGFHTQFAFVTKMAVANMALLSKEAEGKWLCDGANMTVKNTHCICKPCKDRRSPTLSWLRFILPSLFWPVAGQTGKCLGLLLRCGDV